VSSAEYEGVPVAVKEIRREFTAAARPLLEEDLKELRLHKCDLILSIIGFGETDSMLFLVTELCSPRTLREVLDAPTDAERPLLERVPAFSMLLQITKVFRVRFPPWLT
jgi:hypothetical protein